MLDVDDYGPLAEFSSARSAADYFAYCDSSVAGFVGSPPVPDSGTAAAAFRSAIQDAAGRLWADLARGRSGAELLTELSLAILDLESSSKNGIFNPDWIPATHENDATPVATVPAGTIIGDAELRLAAEKAFQACDAGKAPDDILATFRIDILKG